MIDQPIQCRPEAFQFFARQLPVLDSTEGLYRAALAVSMHALDDIRPKCVDARLDELAARVLSQVTTSNPRALLAHLHFVMFEEEKFVGNVRNYFNPLNSYLPALLATHQGLPVTLTLVYKIVAERVGLPVSGLNAPGHFLAEVQMGAERMIVDPFFGGQLLTRDEAVRRVERVLGQPVDDYEWLDAPATHQQWLHRLLANLQNVFASQGRETDLAAMTELQRLLDESLV